MCPNGFGADPGADGARWGLRGGGQVPRQVTGVGACVIAGTWSINEYISKTPTDEIAMNSYYCIPGYYLIEECSPTSAGNLDWILNQFFAKEIELTGGLNGEFYDWLNTTVGLVKIEENDIVFLPFLLPGNPQWGKYGS